MATEAAATPLHSWLDRARHLLPDQGPIGVFVHHNPLHHLEDRPFHEAVAAAARVRGARPYLPESRFRALFAAGRIAEADLRDALPAGSSAVPLAGDERSLRWTLLLHGEDEPDEAGLRYALATGALRPEPEGWAACLARAPELARTRRSPPPRRHRDVLATLGADDPDVPVHRELQRWCGAFLDLGQAIDPMPERADGFWHAVVRAYRTGGAWLTGPAIARRLDRLAGADPYDVVTDALAELGVGQDRAAAFVEATLHALPGWAGMFQRLERRPDEFAHGPVRLLDFLAVRLLLEVPAVRSACTRAGVPWAWADLARLAPPPAPVPDLVTAHRLYGLTGGAGAEALRGASREDLARLLAAADAFPEAARLPVWQEAFEATYRRRILSAVRANRPPGPRAGRPRAAFVFCIDEREESVRRAVEEQGADLDTYGAAGFFGVAIDYQGLDDEHPAAYCPAPIVPAHEVREEPVYSDRAVDASRQRLRAAWQRGQRGLSSGSRALFGGALQSLFVGPFRAVATASRVLLPRGLRQASERAWDVVLPTPTTRLVSLRAQPDARTERGKWAGFSAQEKVDRVAALLTNLGLVRDFPPVVVIVGHGSTSLNNPHESAHDCGACGGRRGGANARLFAEMANRPEVRDGLRARGLVLPPDTWFVGALHDTADDGVTWYDLDQVPPGAHAALEDAQAVLDRARRESARERVRRFDDAPPDATPDEALAHVEGRAASLAQPRPEYGHCTNAVAVVGRRGLTRGLFLDRRAFLVSYDPSADPDHLVLERILAAVGPVGAGINLEYWFSSVDNEAWGCGTKLPHNVTGLLGVMNGHASDLRTGLPWQMVELHEPMRLLLVVEATPAALLAVAARQPEVQRLVVNGWVQLVTVDPEDGRQHRFTPGGFVEETPASAELPRVARSIDWYRGRSEHLDPAWVEAGRG